MTLTILERTPRSITTYTNVYAESNDSFNMPTTSVGSEILSELEMWANAQRDGRPAEYRWRPLFNAAKFG